MKTLRQNIRATALIVGMLAVFALTVFLGGYYQAQGNVTNNTTSALQPELVTYTYFATSTNQRVVSGITYNATSTTATSTNILPWFDTNGALDSGWANIAGAKKATLYLKRGDRTGTGNAGSTKFQIQVTPDGTNWFYWSKLQENASSTIGFTAKTYTIESTALTLVGTSTVVATMDLTNDSFLGVRVIANETTDGDHEAYITVQR